MGSETVKRLHAVFYCFDCDKEIPFTEVCQSTGENNILYTHKVPGPHHGISHDRHQLQKFEPGEELPK
jgi:hypothetical protein